MPNTRHIHLDDAGWELHGRALHTIVWDNSFDDRMTVQFSMHPPDLPVAPTGDEQDLEDLRAHFRGAVESSGGGVLSIDVVECGGRRAVQTLFKFPRKPSPGTVYLASLIIPFREFGYIVRIQCPDFETHSERHRTIFAREMARPDVKIDPATASPSGWLEDPYAPTGPVHEFTRSTADKLSFDEEFPDDALTRARRTLARQREALWFDEEVLSAPAFGD